MNSIEQLIEYVLSFSGSNNTYSELKLAQEKIESVLQSMTPSRDDLSKLEIAWNQVCFENSISSISLNINSAISNESSIGDSPVGLEPLVLDGSDTSESLKGFDAKEQSEDEVIDSVLSDMRTTLSEYKKVYLFKKMSHKSSRPQLILLHDNFRSDGYFLINFKGFQVKTIDSFCQGVEHKIEEVPSDFLCLLVISAGFRQAKDIDRLMDAIVKIDGLKFYELGIKNSKIIFKQAEEKYFYDCLYGENIVHLSNGDLLKNEESLIKKFSAREPHLLIYQTLKGGFSGSKVILTYPAFAHGMQCKFVVKVGDKSKGKILREYEAFKTCVENFYPSYSIEYKENITHEAIRYRFASTDTIKPSMSFTKYYNDLASPAILNMLETIFKHKILEQWEKTQYFSNSIKSYRDLYKKFIKEEEVKSSIHKISIDGKAENAIQVMDQVLNLSQGNYLVKHCHGDFHTENIQIDSEDIFLIDFGLTGEHHAFIDYATLESSIRFKVLPRYVPLSVLHTIDEKYSTVFDADISQDQDIKYFSNVEIKKAFEVIIKIRQIMLNNLMQNQGHTYDVAEKIYLDYLISLYLLSLRQIKYEGLNQAYALQFSSYLGRHILEKFTTVFSE